MGNYLGKKKPNPNLIDESGANNQNLYGQQHSEEQIARSKKTVYRPQIFIDYYKSKLFKVTHVLLSFFCVELELKGQRRQRGERVLGPMSRQWQGEKRQENQIGRL